MLVKDIIFKLEQLAPKENAESYDNIGLLVGSYQQKINKILVTLDITEEVFSEAILNKCNFIISFHPIIFKPIKNITGKNYNEKIIISALKNDISIYSIHTNLDSMWNNGINNHIFKILNVKKEKVLFPKKNITKKLSVYVPVHYADKLRESLFKAGAGNISNYSNCSFSYSGIGTYFGNINSNPSFGKKGIFHKEKEICINVIFPSWKLKEIEKALFKNHPYEEIAYEILNIENNYIISGIGLIGSLKEKMNEYDFLSFLKKKMNLSCIQHSEFTGKKIERISIINGSGRFGIENSIKEKVNAFISSDMKYHDFFKSEKKILIININHYESEKFVKKILKTFLKKNFPSIFVYESKINTNPIKYF